MMRIAVPDFVSSSFFPLLLAKELGLFKEEGQDVEIVHIPALGDVEALRDGAVDFSAGPAHSPLLIFPEWRGVKLVATISQGTPWMLVMKTGLAKRGEIEAVKGHRIAVDRGPDRVFKHLLREGGIDIERDRVEMVPPPVDNSGISFGVAAGRALAAGKVDGLWSNVLGCELAIQQGGGSVVIDTRRGDGPPGAGNYSFAALAVTESIIETKPARVEAMIRGLVRAESVVRQEPARATEVAKKLFPAIEAELMGQILARDAAFYRPLISMEAIDGMNRFAAAVGLLSSPVSYGQVVATQFRSLWSE
jgi:ABC-type nitrate/sulfonate/bicarbonate transport system substrate-binding protein